MEKEITANENEYAKLGERLPKPDAAEIDWAASRVQRQGAGSEIVRRMWVPALRADFEAFLETASVLDIVILYEVFRFKEGAIPERFDGCGFVEAFLSTLGLHPPEILKRNQQRTRPGMA
jgi:hypothetical protein